ncbi:MULTISPECIES: amino acid permease [Paenibacillus]|uniref:amino acid permease n=1 Tax=Paenibacillus TaxID=44249 RepID=UPI00036EA455|nr:MULTISPECIES: amino acid permease [Paenibacillus]
MSAQQEPLHPEAESGQFQRKMKSRHLVMLSLGGVIGTGLFLSSGYTINQAGPLGTILAYLVGAVIVYLVMLCLGELSVHMPVTGAFHAYAAKFIGPGTGYMIAWMYWLTWAVALGSEFTAAGLLMQRWFPDTSVWMWSAIFAILVFLLNAFSVRSFAEAEFWFSGIKVAVILLFIILGGAAVFGLLPMNDTASAPLLSNFTSDGGWFPNGVFPIFMAMLSVNFAFSGTELIGIAAGESVEPEKTIPRAIKATVGRLIIFFVGTIFVLSALIPWRQAGVIESPFVVVFDRIGIPYAADLMNFVIITALLSAANSGLYACSRMLWSLSSERLLPPLFARLTRAGIPLNAMIVSMLGGGLALLSSVLAPDTVYIFLVSVSGFAVVVVWMGITASQFMFRRQYIREGNDIRDLKYRTPLYPLVPIAAFVLCLASCIGIAFDPNQSLAFYCGIAFMVLCYVVYYIQSKIGRSSH